MNLSLFALLFLLAPAGTHPIKTEDAIQSFIQANEAYSAGEQLTEEKKATDAEGKYQEAREIYERLLASGFALTPIYYNLGNAYARLGRWGDAIWSYSSALRLNPRDGDAAANLSYVRTQTVDALPMRGLPPFIRTLLFFHFGLNLRETTFISLALYYLLCIALSFWLFLGRPLITKAGIALSLLLLVFAGSAAFKVADESWDKEAVVVTPKAEVLAGPSEFSQMRFQLHSGAEVEVEEISNGWVKVFVDRERRGWLRSSDCRLL